MNSETETLERKPSSSIRQTITCGVGFAVGGMLGLLAGVLVGGEGAVTGGYAFGAVIGALLLPACVHRNRK